MSRTCELLGVGVQYGNKVSHSNRKTRRRFMPNIQPISLISDALGVTVRLNLSASTVRTVEHNGGLDNFLLTTATTKLTEEGARLKRRIQRAMAKKEEKQAA
jgi:large subunit ribosomal protein L28